MQRTMGRRVFLRLVAGGGVVSLLAACGLPAGTGGTTTEPTTAPGADAPTAAPAQATDAATVLYWDGFQEESDVVDAMITKYNETAEVKVVRESQPQMRDILRTALDAGTGPDIMYYDTGPGFAGVLARAGLLLPLDDAYAEFGWTDRLAPLAKQRATFDGKAYGLGHALELVGMYYNKRIFEEQGLKEPTTHEEVLAAADVLKRADLIPIGFADQDKWPAGHTFSVFLGNIVGKVKMEEAISGKAAWNDPDFVQAIQIPFVDMNQAGYFIPEINAVTYDDWNALFYAGKAAMSLTGSWMIRNYADTNTMPDPVGFFLYPSLGGKPIAPPSGLGSGYFVSQKTKNPQGAFKFLDYLYSAEAAKVWIEDLAIIPPIKLNAADYQVSDLMKFALEAIDRDIDKAGYNIDVLTPENFNNVMFDGFQEVLAGSRTAQEQADALQAAMEDAKKDGKVMDITQ
jgi:raffinose/stachyose/melibiose transport system substrate-binding protein